MKMTPRVALVVGLACCAFSCAGGRETQVSGRGPVRSEINSTGGGTGGSTGQTRSTGQTQSETSNNSTSSSGSTASEVVSSGASSGSTSEAHGWPSLPAIQPVRGVAPRAISNLSSAECMSQLRALGVSFESTTNRRARSDVEAPLMPSGRVGGVSIEFTGRRDQGRVIDCRLLLAIYAWAPALRARGVTRIRHLSGFRPGSRVRTTGRPSGHSRGLAFDPRFFDFDDGRTFDILEDWEDRTRGGSLCEVKNEGAETAEVRALVCHAIDAGLFQVVVSPHHNDAHQNHLHLEVVPGATWTWNG